MKKQLMPVVVLLAATLSTSAAFAAQLTLTPTSVIGSTGSYNDGFVANHIFDQQTSPVSDVFAATYWINREGGPANAFITVDLGAVYSLTGFDLFNTHNGPYGDRGTGNFSIRGGNTVVADGGNGMTLAGRTTTLAVGTLTAAPVSDPIAAQSFASLSGTGVRYLQFLPTSVASVNAPCCSVNEYGLSELRVFGGLPLIGGVPEAATWAMMLAGFGLVGSALRQRRENVAA